MNDVLGGDDDAREDDENVVSITDRARGGENEEEAPEREPEVPADPPVDADHQLTLNVGSVTKAKKVAEAVISLSAAERPINGLLDPDEEIELLVRVIPREYTQRPRRVDGKTKDWKMVQPVSVLAVRRAYAEEEVSDLVRQALRPDTPDSQAEELLLQVAQEVRDRREAAAKAAAAS